MRMLAALLLVCVVADTGNAGIGNSSHYDVPYEAIVAQDNTLVYSGSGSKYYPTGKLARGQRVTVHRHDPGGWYMIAPPSDSFSYIRADYVKQHRGRRGVLTDNNVSVWVGSSVSNHHDVWQRSLSRGDTVEIIDETTLRLSGRPTKVYKIRPPKGEYRWVSGQFITPVDPVARRKHDLDPYNTPGHLKGRQEGPSLGNPSDSDKNNDDHFVERPLVKTTPKKAVQRTVADDHKLEAERDRLQALDGQFRDMVRRDARQWNLAALQRDYQRLQKKASTPALVSQIDLRLDAVDRYRKIKHEYDDFLRLTSETDHRDAELLSIQHRQRHEAARAGSETIVTAPEPGQQYPQMPPQGMRPRNGRWPGPHAHATPPGWGSPRGRRNQRPAPSHSYPPTHGQGPTPEAAGFVGAGIVQRAVTAPPGAPQHVLTAPNGKILAYLQPTPGVNLDHHIGQPRGLHGERMHRNDLHMDQIVVNGLSPVRLIP